MAEYFGRPEDIKRGPPVFAFFTRSEEYISGVWHPFPTTAEALKGALASVGRELEPGAELTVSGYRSDIPLLAGRLPRHVDPDELNYLAAALQSMPLQELVIFRGAVEAGLYCDSAQSLINLACNVGEWLDAPGVMNDEQLGRYLYDNEELTGEEYRAAAEQLHTSYCPDEYFAALGEKYRTEQGGFFTSRGYSQDLGAALVRIPEESRLFAQADAARFPFGKAEVVDLPAFVVKAFSLAGEYTAYTEHDLAVLRKGSYYFMLVNDDRMAVTDAAMTYMSLSSPPMSSWPEAGEAETRAFLLHAEGRPEGEILGTVTEVDYAALKRDVETHAVHSTSVEATLKDGKAASYTREEYQSLELIDRDKIKSWTYRHDPADLAALNDHIKSDFTQAEAAARIVSSYDLLESLNAAYMERADNPNPGMLRITQQAAKDLILGSHSPVYRLMPCAPAELGPKDVIMSGGGLNYLSYREFAVKKTDATRLDKWASAVAGRILPQRQSSVKKDRGER